jgi:hypothetical protein
LDELYHNMQEVIALLLEEGEPELEALVWLRQPGRLGKECFRIDKRVREDNSPRTRMNTDLQLY